jgi:translation initiation factor IF-3
MNGRPMGRDDRRRPQGGLRINHRIRVPEVRVIIDDGDAQAGVMPTHEALRLAEEKGLDLVEISPRAFPPVCRIMDYGKYKFEQNKKKQQARKHASTVEIKEIKFRPKTEGHDMDFKVKHVRRFLEGGNKVRLAVVFRGREITHPQTGKNVLDRVVAATADLSSVEVIPNMEGRRMIMIIAPKPNVVRKAQENRKRVLAEIEKRKEAAKAAGHAPPVEPDDDEDIDEDEINADVGDDDDEAAPADDAAPPTTEK